MNYYIFLRGWQALSLSGNGRSVYFIVCSFIFVSYPLSRFLERTSFLKIAEPFTWMGSFWLAAMAYFFLALVLIDIIRLLDHLFSFLPQSVYAVGGNIKLLLFCISFSIVVLLIVFGFIIARRPRIKRLEINIPKTAPGMKELTIAAVSDIHMGMLIKHRMIGRLARMINGIKPDIVLFVGDTIDEEPDPVMKSDLGKPLRLIVAPLGKYGITGNHEFIGGAKKSIAYIESLGIKVLMDEVVNINGSFNLIGRIDRDGTRFTGGDKRAKLSELLAGVDTSLPLILMDHQPFNLNITAASGIDLQLSGHTHHGQLWPFNYITKAIFELSKGYLKKGNTHIYVSTGYGTWGPPIRNSARPEVVEVKIKFL